MLVGVFAIIAWAFQLGFLVHFISGSVLTGFSAGAALYIMSTQLTTLIGIPSDPSGGFVAHTFFGRIWYTGTHFGSDERRDTGCRRRRHRGARPR